jgi:oligopeptide transport system substrate-binding protein
MTRLLIISILLLLLLAGAMVWSGGGGERPADLSYLDIGDIQTLDPNRMSWMEDIRVGYSIYEGLYTLDPATLAPIPGAAGTIDINDDKTVYTFHLRPEGRWSNGEALVAGDFVFAWKRMLDSPGDYTYLLDCIEGAAEYRAAYVRYLERIDQRKKSGLAGRGDAVLPDFATVGIAVPEPRTLRVTLKHPVAIFPDLAAFPPYFPLNEKSMGDFRKVDPVSGHCTWDREFTRPPHLVTNGPYRLVLWEFKKRIRVVASDYYWDRQNVKCRIVDRLIVEDNKLGQYLRFQTGVVDWLGDVDPSIAAELVALGRRDPAKVKDLHVFPAFGTYFYSFNCLPKFKDGRDNPFKDVRVRRAFTLSLDKRPVVETITRLGEPIAYHYVPPGSLPGYESPERGQVYDPALAKQLLAEAGYPGGRGFPAISLTYNTGSVHGDIAQMVCKQWLDQLGVNVATEPIESAVFKDRLTNKEYAIARTSWYGDYADVSTFTDKYLSNSDNNDSAWMNEEYDRLCYAAAREPDNKKRLAMLRQAEQLLLDEAPIAVVYYYTNRYMYRDNVKGIYQHPRNMVMLKAVEKK